MYRRRTKVFVLIKMNPCALLSGALYMSTRLQSHVCVMPNVLQRVLCIYCIVLSIYPIYICNA